MSNYIQNTKHPKTGKFESAYWIDDYYGPHKYAVRFKDGTMIDVDAMYPKFPPTNSDPTELTFEDFAEYDGTLYKEQS